MAWFILIIAGLFETVWAVSMKYSEGFTKLWPSVITAVAMIISLWLLAIALKSLQLSVAYSVWTAIGALGTVIFGIVFLGESRELIKIFFVMMILGGIVGLKVVSSKESSGNQTEQGKPVGSETKTGNNTKGNS